MLSRLAFKNFGSPALRLVVIRAASTTPPATSSQVPARPAGKTDDYYDPWENPERDYVNFPRRSIPELPPIRHLAIPESYFKAIGQHTGVTGGYMLPATLFTFAASKEYWISTVEWHVAFYTWFWCWFIYYNFPWFEQWFKHHYYFKLIENTIQGHKDCRAREINKLQEQVDGEGQILLQHSSFEELLQVKKEAVALQLEAAYRARLAESYSQVKKKLDFQLEVANVVRKAEQKHMVDWIISNVRKSITAKQEDEALKKCVADLKAMAIAK